MSAQLPRPSASAGTATSGRAVIRSKMGIAAQRQRERAILLAQVDKSREPAIDRTRAFNHSAPATPSSVECAHRLLQRSAMKHSMKLAKRQLASLGKAAPKKKMKSTKATTWIIRELRRLAAFQAQLYIFTKVEKTKADLRYSLIEEQFHGFTRKRIKRACAQLIEGSGAFRLLYEMKEGEFNVELVLKPSCCGKETSSSYVAGVHFTEDDIRTFGHNKKVNGRALWAMGLTVLRTTVLTTTMRFLELCLRRACR
jgi:hypothetical protein